jgi:hypothetical protein
MIVITDNTDSILCQLLCRGFGVVDRHSVNLTVIDRPSRTHLCFGERVGDFKVYFDISGRGLNSLLVEDIEWDISGSPVVLIALQWQQ